jgi:hypothetical protein
MDPPVRGDRPNRLLLASASALSGQQAEAGEAIKAYLASSEAKSRTISQFQKQQLAMANNPKWLAYRVALKDIVYGAFDK